MCEIVLLKILFGFSTQQTYRRKMVAKIANASRSTQKIIIYKSKSLRSWKIGSLWLVLRFQKSSLARQIPSMSLFSSPFELTVNVADSNTVGYFGLLICTTSDTYSISTVLLTSSDLCSSDVYLLIARKSFYLCGTLLLYYVLNNMFEL